MNSLNDLLGWVDKQDNWISAIGHGAICAGVMTVGLLLAWLSTAADDTLAQPILTFFAGMCIGGYTLREADDSRKAVGQPGEGHKLGESFEDWIVPVTVTIALGIIYSGLI